MKLTVVATFSLLVKHKRQTHPSTVIQFTCAVKQAYNHHQMVEHSDLNTYHLAALGIQMTSDLFLSLGREALACYQFTINLSSYSNFHHKSNHIHSHLC